MCITPPPDDPFRGQDDADAELFDLGFSVDDLDYLDHGPEREGARIGRYRLIRELGEGGFGTVWKAEQLEPVRRELALKLIKRGMNSREVIARFESESQALAMMDHPNIAAVFDAGTTRDGRPYFALEMVKGEPLTIYCDSRGLTIRDRVALFIPVCHAVQHAHQKAILHRDLKPSNILVTVIDGKAVPKVIDFGVAKALDSTGQADLAEEAKWTRAGVLLGTPEYMSPEQAGTMPDVDTRSDIYSLGVVLHELLTGITPLGRIPGKDRPIDETLRNIRMHETARPSSVFHSAADEARLAASLRGGDIKRARRTLKGDLDWIVLKALEKDRRRRYPTATALAADLTAYLEEKPVAAAAPTWSYQFRKMARRNKALAGALAIAFTALGAATGISLWHAAQSAKERALAIENQEEADAERALAVASQKEADRNRALAEASAREAEANAKEAEASAKEAKEAVELYLNRVTDHARLKEESFLSLRRDLLESALAFYERSVMKTANDPKALAEHSWALGKIGVIYRSLGDKDKAVDALSKAAAIDERLSKENPEDVVSAKNLCVTWTNLALILREQGKPEEAIVLQRRALDRMDELVKAFPERSDLLQDEVVHLFQFGQALADLGKLDEAENYMLRSISAREMLSGNAPDQARNLSEFASALADFGRTMADKGRFADAEIRYRKAMEIQERLGGAESAPFQYRAALAGTCHNFGYFLVSNGRVEEGLALQRKGVAIGDGLCKRYPSTPWYRYLLASGQFGVGTSLSQLGREDEAEGSFRDSAENYRILAGDSPDIADYRHRAGISLERTGRLRKKAGDAAGARECFAANVVFQRKALDIQPENKTYRAALAEGLDLSGNAFLEAGEAKAVMAVAGEITRVSPDGWREHERAARMMAVAYGLFRDNTAMRQEERAGMMEMAVVSATGILRRSFELGNPGTVDLLADPVFADLRGDQRFQELERSLKPDPAGKSPTRFAYDYAFSDPGPRVWRFEGGQWSETPPSGDLKRFNIVRRMNMGGVSGTELIEAGGAAISIFIPDLGSPGPLKLMYKAGAGEWRALGEMTGVE